MVIDDTGSEEGIYAFIYILHKVAIWSGVTDALRTDFEDRATQLLIKCKSGALVTQLVADLHYLNREFMGKIPRIRKECMSVVQKILK